MKIKTIGSLLCAILLASCTDVPGATKALERSGYKPLQVGGYAFFGHSESDHYATKFRAVALNGDTVSGVVTRGLFMKGNTIRLND